MSARQAMFLFVAVFGVTVILGQPLAAQVVDENFDTVTGAGGGPFHSGPGLMLIDDWDSGILGENAFAGAEGNARFDSVSAAGLVTGGVAGSGGGRIDVSGVTFELLFEDFSGVTATGGGPFLVGDGSPNTFDFTTDWDDGISGEGAFGGTSDGAILVGNMSAQGLTSGGVSGGAGQIAVSNVNLLGGNWFAGLQWDVGQFPGATPLVNAGFENGTLGIGIASWTRTGNVYTEDDFPRTGIRVAKMFGTFPGNSSFYQDLPAQPGQIWALDVFSRHNAGDSISANANTVTMTIQFRDSGGVLVGSTAATILSNASPLNTWIDNTPITLTAPAGTASARALFTFVQVASAGGAGFLDDATFKVIAGPNPVDLSNFSLTTAVKGTANGGAGEVLGNYQLRIEDADGDRLIFHGLATSGYQTIGGNLSTAVEADSTGTPASDVFDASSASFRVVVAFDNDAANAWGTGGTLTVNDLLLSNTSSDGSAWFAGLYWDELTGEITNPSQWVLSADVLGGTVGGAYELRLEAFKLTEAGLDDDFESATGVGADILLDGPAIDGGQVFGFTANYDEGLTHAAAFGGVFGLIDTQFAPIFVAEAVTSGGNPGKAGQIRVENVSVGPGGGWFAGLDFGAHALASTDLSQVILSADIRGTIPMSGGFFGDYELRIEDAEGDRLYFPMVADGTWQSVGGPLSTALEGPALDGSGDGNFDLDSPSYAVVVSFINPELTWFFGGILTVDNTFLTPITVGTEIGRVSFFGESNGSFQSIGGLLSDGETNLGDYTQNFSAASVTGGGNFGGGTGNWDDGIVGENAFFGTFGNAVNGGGGSAQACASCGIGGTKAGQLSVASVTPNTGGWFAGVFFENIRADLSGDLSQVILSADIRGVANAGAGETLGTYFFRIEDDTLTGLTFTVTANGSFQSVGGPLSTAMVEIIPGGDAIFDFNQADYNITIGFVGTASNWGTGGTLTFDNLFLTGVSLDDADAYVVTLTFDEELATWGTNGSLTIDNLFLGEVALGDMNCDGVLDMNDVSPFVLALIDPAAYNTAFGMDCDINNADVNQDGFVNGLDVEVFTQLLTGQ